MAAVDVEMGETDDIHSKDGSVTEAVIMNGDVTEAENEKAALENDKPVSDIDKTESDAEPESAPSPPPSPKNDVPEDEEPMDVDEEEAKSPQIEEPKDQVEEADPEPEPQEKEERPPSVNSKKGDDTELVVKDVEMAVEDSIACDDDEDEADVSPEVHDIDDNSDDDIVQVPKESEEHVVDGDGECEIVDSHEVTDELENDDVVIIEGETDIVKENGDSLSEKNGSDDCTIVDLNTPEKKDASLKEALTPRRSVRNLHKSRSYIVDSDKEATPSEESDVEEVVPQDPLAGTDPLSNDKIVVKKRSNPSSTIVVKDTKRLVEIASKSTPNSTGKKEPTLVIIDTNSILSGRGPVPISKSSSSPSTYPMLPVALPAQGMYSSNMRATITPIPMNTSNKVTPVPIAPASASTPQAPILPSLTDDMFVVEAPSFIVPYVYEKPPMKDLKGYVTTMKEDIQKMRDEEDKEDDKEKENEDENKDEKGSDDGSDKTNDKIETIDLDDRSDDKNKRHTYFDSPIGKFFVDIGSSLVQEFVQSDLLKQQKRKREREGGQNSATQKTINSLLKSLEYTKENNRPYRMEMKKCEFCSYKTESALAMAFHLETPHMKNFVYRCNFCPYEVRSPHDILFHMEAEHCVRGRLERAPAFHQCPNCPFEDNQKGKLSRHQVACSRKFKPERNLEPPFDWEPPAKIPRAPRMKQQPSLSSTAAMYQAMTKTSPMQYMKMQQNMVASLTAQQQAVNRGRGRPSGSTGISMPSKQNNVKKKSNIVYEEVVPGGASVLVPTNYQISGNQLYQNSSNKTTKTVHQPSISITPLPRGTSSTTTPVPGAKPGDSNSKNSFVICEICDGYIKDLEQLRNHMQWIHKIKIHPKMIYNRPPLNCQKCQFRFFTDQGLERHLLGSHGLVTSSMQEAANKCKDSGRCPVCGRVYQWKLLNHVARDHNMTLKPAHLSYKCTVCTATFGMYKQFENHVYSAHSVVAKRTMDKKTPSTPSSSGGGGSPGKGESLLKPLKINDEITIIPQMPKSNGASGKEGSPSTSSGQKGSGSSKSKKDGPLTGSAIESGEIQIINLG